MTPQRFKSAVWNHYDERGRHGLPWRKIRDPYRILVSEVMLQQTQVSRVLKKYDEFLAEFPSVEALASAPVSRLLSVWKGLGYNRRALNLKRAAEAITREHDGTFPRDPKALEGLPGIGPSTRGAIMAFAFGVPTAFIETNVRAAFIHCFFSDRSDVRDAEILPLVEKTLPSPDAPRGRGARDWYYALMDYGVHLKATLPNPSRKSAHHVRQSAFKGSNRELRSRMLSVVMEGPIREGDLVKRLVAKGARKAQILRNLDALEKEGFIGRKRKVVAIA